MIDHQPSQVSRGRWIKVKAVEEIPAFSPCRMIGADGLGIVHVMLPTDDSERHLACNGPRKITAGRYGNVTVDYPAYMAYDTANVPSNGERWGSEAGSSTIHRDQTGFLIVGGPTFDANRRRVLVMPDPTCCVEGSGESGSSGLLRCSCCHPFPPKRTYIMTLTRTGTGGTSCGESIVIPITLIEAIDEPPSIPCAIFWRTWVGGPVTVSSGVHGSCSAYGQMRCKVFQDGCLGFYLNAVIRSPFQEMTVPWEVPWDDAATEINGTPGVCDCEDFEITPSDTIDVTQSSCCYDPPDTVGQSFLVQVLE